MKNLKLLKIWLLSASEAAARKESFDGDVTVIFGDNDTGKSHLIKSIYAAFGADASAVNDKWKRARTSILLRFAVDDDEYSILRVSDQFALFDAYDVMLWTGTSLVKDVGPGIAMLLDFTIQLPTKTGASLVPPPQFWFLPFYQDQDRGWNAGWASFKHLGMIPDYRRLMMEYHTGIRPREYYEALADKLEAVRNQKDFRAERQALDRAIDRLHAGRPPLTVTFEPEKFEQQIVMLLAELNEVRSVYDSVKQRVAELQSRRATLVEEVEIAQTALKELDADFRFMKDVTDTQVICPTCHTVHENDFANRFGLIGDVDACRGFLASAKNALVDVEKDIAHQLGALREHSEHVARIDAILEETRGAVKLRDMLNDESERILDATMAAERTSIVAIINEWLGKEADAVERMKVHGSAERKAKIISFYARKLSQFSIELGVQFGPEVHGRVAPTINETGSYGSRSILAYHYALLHTIRAFTTSALCPIVLDTPLQQDQDADNATAMIRFALKNRPDDMQLVLGTVSLHDVDYEGHIINPNDKESLLRKSDFESVNGYMRPFINMMLGQGQGELF